MTTMIARNRGKKTDRFGTSLQAKIPTGIVQKAPSTVKGEAALSLLAMACEQMARGEKPLQNSN